MFAKGHTPSHKESLVTSEPIRDLTKIAEIKDNLKDSPREYALFCLGINTAFRAGDLLKLKMSNLRYLDDSTIEISVKEEKTGKVRIVIVNNGTADALRSYIATRLNPSSSDYLFMGERGKMTTSFLTRLVKTWVKSVGVTGNYSTHTLRKTWAYHQFKTFNVRLAVLMTALNHSSERQTLAYIGLLASDVQAAYANTL
jgi:integrase